MGNDIQIDVRVANHSAAGLGSVTQSLNRLRSSANDANSSVTALRASLASDMTISARLDNQTETDIAAINTAIRELEASSPIRLEAEFRGDTAEIMGSARAMADLRSNAQRTNTALTSLVARATAAAAALTLLRAAADEAAEALRALRGRTAAAAESMRDLREGTTGAGNALRTLNTRLGSADGRMSDLSNRSATLRNDMNELDGAVQRTGGSLNGLRGSLGTYRAGANGASASTRKLLMAALALSPALIPITAAVTPLVPALGALSVATLAFGAALIPQILALKKISEADKAYSEALKEHGETSKQAAQAESQFLKTVQNSSPEVRKAAASLSIFKSEFKDWSKSLEGNTLPVATKSFAVLGELFPKLTPLVKATSAEFGRLMDRLAVGVQSDGFDEFMAKFTDFSTRTLRSAMDGLVGIGRSLAGLGENKDFQRFMDYTKENGPLVAETFRNLMRVISNFVEGLSGVGVSILTVVNALAQLAAAIPPSLISAFVQTYTALKLFSLGVAAVSAVTSSGAVARLAAYFAIMRAAGVATTLQATAASMSGVARAGVALGVLAVVAVGIGKLAEKARGAPPDVDRLTTSLKKLAETGQFTGEFAKTFGDIDGLVAKIGQLGQATKEQQEYIDGFGKWQPKSFNDLRRSVHGLFDDMVDGKKSLNALKADFKSLDEAMAGLATSGHADVAAANFQRIADAAQAQGYSLQEVQALLPQYGDAVAALEADQRLAAQSMGLFGEQAHEVQKKLDGQKQSADGLRQSLQALNDVNRIAMGGMIGFEAAIDAAAKAASDNAGSLHMVNGTLDLNSEKSRTAASALADLAAKTDEAAASARDNGSSWSVVNSIYERGREKLIGAAQQMGLTRDQARLLAEQILRTPDKTAQLKGNMDDLRSKLEEAKKRLASVPDSRKAEVRAEIGQLTAAIRRAENQLASMRKNYTITIHYQTTGSPYPPSGGREFAHGGVIGAAGGGPRSRMTLVGEQGPELVDLAPGSRVRSNPDTRRLMSGAGGGGSSTPMVVQVVLDGRVLASQLVDPMRAEIFGRGGNVQSVLGQRGA